MDINRALRMAIDTGKVLIGVRETERALKKNKVRLVIIASNCRPTDRNDFELHSGVPIYQFNGTNIELGSACGKPFPISTLAIIDQGDSNIMEVVKK